MFEFRGKEERSEDVAATKQQDVYVVVNVFFMAELLKENPRLLTNQLSNLSA